MKPLLLIVLACASLSGQMVGLVSPGPGTAHTAAAGGIVHISAIDKCGTGATAAVSTVGANFLVAKVTGSTTVGATLTDNCGTAPGGVCSGAGSPASNTWAAMNASPAVAPQGQMWYAQNPTVGSGFVLTVGSVAFSGVCQMGFSGMSTTTVSEGTATAQNPVNQLTGASIQAGPATPIGTGQQLVMAGCADFDVGGTFSFDSGFSTPIFLTAASGVNYGVALSYLIVNTNSAVNPTCTASGGSNPMSASNAIFQR